VILVPRIRSITETEGRCVVSRIALLTAALGTFAGVVVLVLRTFPEVEAAAIVGDTLPAGYRDWRLISVAREEGDLDDIRAILGNDTAIEAYRENTRPFPDGTVIARLAWSYDSSEENDEAFGRRQSFVAGHPKNGVQFMFKDSRKHAATGGWAYAQFDDGEPLRDAAMLRSCFECHRAFEDHDYVFTRYAP
jgi:hypothetical protein